MNKIKEYIWTRKVGTAKNVRTIKGLAKKLAESKQIGVIFQEDEYDGRAIEYLSERLRKYGATVKFIGISESHQSDIACPYPLVSSKDFSTFGGFKNAELQEFLNTYFDFVFCLSKVDGFVETIMLSHCKATIRVGKYLEGGEELLDLMIGETKGDYKEFLAQMLWLAEAIN